MAALGDIRGEPVRSSGAAFSRWVIDSVIRRSAELVTAAALSRDGIDPVHATGILGGRALDQAEARRQDANDDSLVDVRVSLSTPLVALGASAAYYYPGVGELVGADCRVPEHAEVANAVGAAVGQVRVARTATISQPSKGRYRIHWPGVDDRADLQPAIDDALAAMRADVTAEAMRAGAESVTLHHDVETRSATIEGRDFFVEATVTMIGTGPPKAGPAGPDPTPTR